MNIILEKQAPYTENKLKTFCYNYKSELIEENPKVKILFVDPKTEKYFDTTYWKNLKITMEFQDPEFDENIIYFYMGGIRQQNNYLQFKNTNPFYDLINGLLISDKLIGSNNVDAITVNIDELVYYLTNKEFILDGRELSQLKMVLSR